MQTSFPERCQSLPFLGIGVSTEYGARAAAGSLDVSLLRRTEPGFAAFLEVGVETRKGLDSNAERWIDDGLPCTYHFLDINLDEPEDFDRPWLEEMRRLTDRVRPAWLCGDAGARHFGSREPAQMLLLPPILTDDGASRMAEGIVRLRDELGLEVLPENPPGSVYVGDMHLLEFFRRVCERADTGMLLDAAHLAIYQQIMGCAPTDWLDRFPLDRVIEMHVAGGAERTHDGLRFIEDTHTLDVLAATWEIVEAVAPQATELRAVVLECDRNPYDDVVPGFRELESHLADSPFGRRREAER